MYIIHFQRNAQSMNGLWCEKSLWGFKAPHGARCIDCTLLRNGSSVRANKWEPKRNKKKKKTRNERGKKRLEPKINSSTVRVLLKANRKKAKKSCTYRHIDVFISHSLLELWTMLLQASEEWTPKPSPPPHSLPPVLGRSEQQEEMMRWKIRTWALIRSKIRVPYIVNVLLSLVLFFYLNSASIGRIRKPKHWRARWKVVFIVFTRTWVSEQETFSYL